MREIPREALIRDAIPPDAPASEAMARMDALRRDALLVEGGARAVLRSDLERRSAGRVSDAMRPMILALPEGCGALQAARLMAAAAQRFALCADGSALVDLHLLLEAMASPRDPHTGLEWSGALRAWGEAAFEQGQEISILFFDLNDFGQYNKRFGHVVGDRVLRAFAERLREECEPGRDVAVRYGGDEFAVGTPLHRAEAEALARRISARPIRVEEVPEPVGFSWGVSGGKRTRERLQAHFAATVDNLINLASQDCLGRKVRAKAQARLQASSGLHDVILYASPAPSRVVTGSGAAASPELAAALGWIS